MDAHVKASITLGSTEEALKAIEELKKAQDFELMSLLKEREELVAKHEKLKAEHKVNVDKAKIRAQALGTNPLASERLSDQSEISALDNPVFARPHPPRKNAPQHQHQHQHQHAPPMPDAPKRGSAACKLHEIALKSSAKTMPVRSNEKAPPRHSAAFSAMAHALAAQGQPGHGPSHPSGHVPPQLPHPSQGRPAPSPTHPRPPPQAHGGASSPVGSPILHWSPQPAQVDLMVQAGGITPTGMFC